jgi:hypothetical protein
MKKTEGWAWVIGVLAFTALCGVLVGVGVVLNAESEPTFLEDAIAWTPEDLPLAVCSHDLRVAGGAPEEHSRRSLEHAVSVTNGRLGFEAFRLADEPCEVAVTFGVPAEPGMRDPGGDASWRPGERVCHVAIVNVHGELQTLALRHELGHCLGLAHDDFERSIMFPTQRETEARALPPWISDVDRAALRERLLR